MTYTKESPEWLLIRANSNNWFSKENLKFWGSKIYWNSLCNFDGNWYFITAEDNFDRSEKLFSIRSVSPKFDFETIEWQTLNDLPAARKRLKELTATEPCVYCDVPVAKETWEEESYMCLNCSNDFYDHKINPYDQSTWPKYQKASANA
jgi:hypothetical protein